MGYQALGALLRGEAHIYPRKSCPAGCTEASSFLKPPCSSISDNLLGGWVVEGSHLKPEETFWLFLASAIVCACLLHLQVKAQAALQDYRAASCLKHFVFSPLGSFITFLLL